MAAGGETSMGIPKGDRFPEFYKKEGCEFLSDLRRSLHPKRDLRSDLWFGQLFVLYFDRNEISSVVYHEINFCFILGPPKTDF
jgi:hypothetical protein